MRALLSLEQCQVRLELIFPRDAFDTVVCNPLAAASVAAMLYVDSVVPDEGDLPADTYWTRPSTVLWMSDEAYARGDEDSRRQWGDAARRTRKKLDELLESWIVPNGRWYADTSRETLRDETWPEWAQRGAARDLPGVPKSSSKGRWALAESFADLFDPSLRGDALVAAVEGWRATHLSPGDLLKIDVGRERGRQRHSVVVTLPRGAGTRELEFGDSSLILKGVVEQWAPVRMSDPVVLTISEPGNKILLADERRLHTLGVRIDAANLLPDCVIVDIGTKPQTFWIIEAVASDGEIDERRRAQLLQWAADQRIDAGSCSFLSAFISRNHSAARKRLKDLASGTFAWYLDEPERELAWYEVGPDGPPAL